MLPGTGALVGRWPTRLVPRRQRDVASGQFTGPSSLGHAKANRNLAEESFSVTPGRGSGRDWQAILRGRKSAGSWTDCRRPRRARGGNGGRLAR